MWCGLLVKNEKRGQISGLTLMEVTFDNQRQQDLFHSPPGYDHQDVDGRPKNNRNNINPCIFSSHRQHITVRTGNEN